MIQLRLVYILISIYHGIAWSQHSSIPQLLKKSNHNTIPYIMVDTLAKAKTNYIILDAREKEEFNTSHLENATHVGYTNFSILSLKKVTKSKHDTIVVYCSLGVRSEIIGEQIKNAGYTNVFNLYGGIFEWKNKGYRIVDTTKTYTDNVHVFSKKWKHYLTKGIKIY